jgi:hypothetical protein
VRSALLLARDPEDPEGEEGRRRVLAHFKCNVGPLAPTLLYEVEGAPALDAARVRFLGESSADRDELLTRRTAEERSEREEALDFLRAELAGGPQPTRDVKRAASEAGISERTLARARKDLGVRAEKDGLGPWVLRLPEGCQAPVAPFAPPAGGTLHANPHGERDCGLFEPPAEAEGCHVSRLASFGASAAEQAEAERVQAKFPDLDGEGL